MEHLATFGLKRDPFGCDAQLIWYFDAVGFAAASERLQRAAIQAKGLCIVSGRGGVGKTMLVRHLLETLEEEVFEASLLVAVPGVTDMLWLLTRWAQQLGVEAPSNQVATVLAQVYEQLAIVREDGRKAVLIIDEAQVLAERGILAELRGLLNLEYEDKRLVTVILVGSSTLPESIANEPALAERVDLRLAIQPLHAKEVVGYVHHRIRAAGGNPAILESSAIASLTRLCGGIPRRINALADDALFEAHRAGRVSATAAHVERAAAELGIGAPEDTESGLALTPSDAQPAPPPDRRTAPPPSPRRREPPADSLFVEAADELELGEVIAEPTGRRAASPSATVLMPPAIPSSRPLAEEPQRGSGGPREFQLDDTSELEDLFADIVDE